MEWYLKVVRDNYINFSGRARRKEYWMFMLFHIILCCIAAVLDNILGLDFTVGSGYYEASVGYGWIYLLYALVTFLPSFSLVVRRLHDVGKSGWFILISIIPLIGAIWFLVLMCTDGNSEENTYGPSPKA